MSLAEVSREVGEVGGVKGEQIKGFTGAMGRSKVLKERKKKVRG